MVTIQQALKKDIQESMQFKLVIKMLNSKIGKIPPIEALRLETKITFFLNFLSSDFSKIYLLIPALISRPHIKFNDRNKPKKSKLQRLKMKREKLKTKKMEEKPIILFFWLVNLSQVNPAIGPTKYAKQDKN